MTLCTDALGWRCVLLSSLFAVGCGAVLPRPLALAHPEPGGPTDAVVRADEQKVPTPPKGAPRLSASRPVPDLRIPNPPADSGLVARADPPAVIPAQATVPQTPDIGRQLPAQGTAPELPLPPTAPTGGVAGGVEAILRMRQLHRQAADRYSGIDSYVARLRRREVVGGKSKPEEVMLFKFRKQPWSVYFKWLSKEGQGREVIYVKGQHEDKIHSLLAAGDMPFAPAGKRISLPPDSIFVRNSSRHGITDAGIGVLIERIGELLDAAEKGDHRLGTPRYLGLIKRPEFVTPVEAAELVLPAGYDPLLPRGGRRLLAFDQESHLPVLLVTFDDTGREVEYYCYDLFQYPVKLDDDDFNPDRLWGARKDK